MFDVSFIFLGSSSSCTWRLHLECMYHSSHSQTLSTNLRAIAALTVLLLAWPYVVSPPQRSSNLRTKQQAHDQQQVLGPEQPTAAARHVICEMGPCTTIPYNEIQPLASLGTHARYMLQQFATKSLLSVPSAAG